VQDIPFEKEKITTLGLAEHIHLEDKPSPAKIGDNYRIAARPEDI
jgi:hypothetical protein